MVEDKRYTFRVVGLFNGLALMADNETDSHWDHVAGECIEGRHRGYELERGALLHYDTAGQVLLRYPEAKLALSRSTLRSLILQRMAIRHMLTAEGHLPPFFFKPSLAGVGEDDRRERMELGLGVLDEHGSGCFYPREVIDVIGPVIDAERGLVVYMDPVSKIPVAVHTKASSCRMEGEELVLNTGERIRDRRIVGAPDGEELDQPPQQFTRWYGFSLTYPGCGLYTD